MRDASQDPSSLDDIDLKRVWSGSGHGEPPVASHRRFVICSGLYGRGRRWEQSSAVAARVERLGGVGYLGRLLDYRPALVLLDHRLHVRQLVTGDDHEAARIRADPLVIGLAQTDLLTALGVRALAEVQLDLAL